MGFYLTMEDVSMTDIMNILHDFIIVILCTVSSKLNVGTCNLIYSQFME